MTTFKFREKSYPIRISMGSLLRYKRMTGKDINTLDGTNIEEILTLLFCMILSSCVSMGIEFGYSFEEFADMIDGKELTSITDAINEVSAEFMKAVQKDLPVETESLGKMEKKRGRMTKRASNST